MTSLLNAPQEFPTALPTRQNPCQLALFSICCPAPYGLYPQLSWTYFCEYFMLSLISRSLCLPVSLLERSTSSLSPWQTNKDESLAAALFGDMNKARRWQDLVYWMARSQPCHIAYPLCITVISLSTCSCPAFWCRQLTGSVIEGHNWWGCAKPSSRYSLGTYVIPFFSVWVF